MSQSGKKQVIVVGGGFAGMACVRRLKKSNADVKLIDRRNFHLFQPLLYQVASGGLSPANIAAPLRSIFKRQKNVQVLMGDVCGFDLSNREVHLDNGTKIPFDYLVVATGSTHHYFGRDQDWESLAPGLKTVEDATEIRRRILSAFERAERTADPLKRTALLTFVVVGGGPTGVEMAGAICELAHQTMKHEFRSIDPAKARVVLIENSKLVLDKYDPTLSAAAARDLTSLGTDVWNETRLTEIHDDHVMVTRAGTPERLDCHTVVWAAGVKASGLGKLIAEQLGAPELIDRGGRVSVDAQCRVRGQKQIFVAGDMAWFDAGNGKTLPGVAPVAMQQGDYIGKLIANELNGVASTKAFEYWDKGNMATIGRSRAVVESGKWKMSGKLAWLAWLFIHILYLARFENRVLVLFQWFWNYITRNRTARLITDHHSSNQQK